MRHKLINVALAAMMLLSGVGVEAKKLHTIGDSTMQTYDESTDKRGWAQMLQQFFDAGKITVNNRGKSGASSKSFYKESAYWPTMVTNGTDQMQQGDILVIQFAHNDEKSAGTDGDEENALHAALSDGKSVDYRGTTPFGTYKEYLKKYIDEAKAMGVKPILVGPICRKYFSNGAIRRNGRHDLGDKFNLIKDGILLENQSISAEDNTMDYVWQMQQVASEYDDVPFIDLTEATAQLYISYGEAYCTSHLFCSDDSTHPKGMGATLIARLFAELVHKAAADEAISDKKRAVLEELDDAIMLSSEISFSPSTGDLGKTYTGQTINKEFNVSAFGLTPEEGTVTFTATEGFLVSTDKVNYAATASTSYSGSTLIAPLYVRYQANAGGTIEGEITASNGSISSTLKLTLEVGSLGGEAFSILYPLAANWDANVTGVDETAAVGETFKNMEVKQYGAIDTGKESMQLLQISGQAADGSWPANEIDEVSDRFVQFAFQCPEGKKLTITKLGLHVAGRGGNGLCAKVYYSTDASFSKNTQIFEQSKMTNKQVYPIDETVAINLEEGDRIYIRVYPWYSATSVQTGKWLCVDSVYVQGQAENAGGVEINGTITYGMHTAGTDQTPEFDPETMMAGFIGKTISAGSSLTMTGTSGWTGSDEKVTMASVYNGTSGSFPTTATEENTLVFTLTPDDGFYFTPSAISFKAAKFGTDGGTITASIEAGANSQSICSGEAVNRGANNLTLKQISADISGIVASATEPLKLKISFCGLGKTKTMGISDVVITGTLQGAQQQTTKYTLTTSVMPSGAGTITVNPELGSYKEGSKVELTATKNFGYAFSEWQDESGKTLSTEEKYEVTMDANKTINAIFATIPVYTVTTSCTNDAERSLGSITLTPNEHDGKYEEGTKITAKANESNILKFLSWTDSEENAGTSATRTLTVTKDMTLVANYEVQDFIAVFDASRVQGYASNSTYPFAADLTWDEERNASAKIVKEADGTLLKGVNGTPVVRNREQVVLAGLNGLYQNGYNTAEIAWQYQFSTVGFTSARIVAQMAAKNAATKNWKAQYSVDGTTFTDIEGAAWQAQALQINDIHFDLPEACVGQKAVYIRLMGVGTELFNTTYPFDKTADDGMKYCDHSESGFGNLYVLGEAVVEADEEAPVLIATLPADQASNISASGKVTFSYDERIHYGAGTATLTHGSEVKDLNANWNARSVSFDYVGLTYGETYTISFPEGYVQDKSGNKAAAAELTFTIMQRQAPEARTFDAIVDHTLKLEHGKSIAATDDMPAQYRYIQDAIDAAPEASTTPYLIYIREGYYNDPNWTFSDSYGNYIENGETKNTLPSGINQYDSCRIVWVNKPNIHLIGQEVDKVTIATDRLAGSVGNDSRVWYHVNAGATIIVTEKGTGFHIENITVDNENWTIKHMEGPQALCLRVRSDKTVFNNIKVRSYQDSYYSASGFNRQFWFGSTIEGAVDFIYGDGEVFFESCTLNINRKQGGYIVAPNHKKDYTRWGYVFNNTKITTTYAADPSTYQIYFGRPWHDTPYTVFLHTQCEVTPYAGYWYPTMGGLPALWAVYDIWDKNGNKMSETSIKDFYYTDDSGRHEGESKNYLTAEEAAQYTIANVMSGDGTSNPETGVWNPLEVIEKTATPVLQESNGTISWDEDEFAICYVVTVNGKAVAFPTEAIYQGQAGDVVSVQSVNEFGSLSARSKEITIGAITGIEEIRETNNGIEKIVRDGQIIIIKDGVSYNILGAKL